MYVFPEYRGKGLSRKLIEAGIKELQKNSEIRLNVFAGNFAKEMYEQFGFVERQVIMTLKENNSLNGRRERMRRENEYVAYLQRLYPEL